MRNLMIRAGLVGSAAALTIVGFAGTGVAAETGAGAIVGSGSISPGLSLAGAAQTVSFSGTGAGAGNPVSSSGAYTCSTNDTNDSIGTYGSGAGGGTLKCVAIAGASGESDGAFTYQRDGSVVIVNGSFPSGPLAGSYTAACLFEPAGANGTNITNYELQCAFAFGA